MRTLPLLVAAVVPRSTWPAGWASTPSPRARRAPRGASSVQEQAVSALSDLGLLSDGLSPAPPPAAVTRPAPERRRKAASPAPRTTAPGADLAIPDFDSLAASQVIPRLEGLSPEELEAVRAYEAGRRGRKTILNKIAQLQG